MAFYSVVDDTDDSQELPWFNEFEQSTDKDVEGEYWHVDFVKSTPKGFILTTCDFNAWVWRKTPVGETLALNLRQATQTDSHPCLAIMGNKKSKNKFSVGFLDDSHCKFTWNAENNTFTLHPQKNLPLDIPPEDDSESKGATSLGNLQKPSSVPPRTSVTSSKVQSSQKTPA